MKDFLAWFLIACGSFGFLGGALDWSYFMESRKAQFFVRFLGRGGTRAFYVLLGAALVALGVCGLLGYVDLPRSRR